MRRRLALGPCYSLVLLLASCTASAQGVRQKTMEEIVNAPVVLTLPRMNEVKVTSDLEYSKAADPNLRLDVYVPPDLREGQRAPVVMFIHGGAGSQSRPKDWGFYKTWGRLAAASGIVGVTFTHRLGAREPLFVESAQDVGDAIDYVRANAARLHVDPDRICLAASSAGGPMLVLGLDEKRPCVRCIVAYYAFLDIQQSSVHRQYEPAERVKQFSVIERLGDKRALEIPWFIARGGRDTVPTVNDSIDRFVARAIRDNANVIVMNHPTGVHAFDNQNDDDRSREIITASLMFLKRHLTR